MGKVVFAIVEYDVSKKQAIAMVALCTVQCSAVKTL